MPVPVKMPKLGLTMTEGTLVSWLVKEGDKIEKKQEIAEIETDKIVNQLSSPADGTLVRITAQEGDEIDVAETIAWILADGESESDISTDDSDGSAIPVAKAVSTETAPLEQTETQQDESNLAPWSDMRKAIARTVTQSAAVPQITLFSRASASTMMELREVDRTIAYDDVIIFCVSRTLKEHPNLNSSYENAGLRIHPQANVGLAIAMDEGLMIPVVKGACGLSLPQISEARKHLVDLVRSHSALTDELEGGTFTVTNLGMFPVDRFTALLYPSQTGILSVGRIQQLAVSGDNGQIALAPFIELGLTLDHRVADGAAGAAFLRDLVEKIENLRLEDE
jgi:pyruvate dehydrogenase E2 component (dihydrolipoamide acetyltransferase)